MKENENDFLSFGKCLKEMWIKGRTSACLWIYLFVGIILCGGAGFWLLLLQKHLNLTTPDLLMTFCSFSPAIAGASCMDFILGENERKFLRAFSILFWALVLVATFIAFFSQSYLLAVLATILALSIWWFANTENPKLSPSPKPLSPVGGNPDNNVEGDVGDIAL